MPKIDLNLYKGKELVESHKGVLINNEKLNNIIFNINDVNMSITFSKDELILKRYNQEFEFILKINNKNECTYKLIKENLIFDITVEEASFQIKERYIKIAYKIETEKEEFRIIIVKK